MKTIFIFSILLLISSCSTSLMRSRTPASALMITANCSQLTAQFFQKSLERVDHAKYTSELDSIDSIKELEEFLISLKGLKKSHIKRIFNKSQLFLNLNFDPSILYKLVPLVRTGEVNRSLLHKSFGIPTNITSLQNIKPFRQFRVEFEGHIKKTKNPYTKLATNIYNVYNDAGSFYHIKKNREKKTRHDDYMLAEIHSTPFNIKYHESPAPTPKGKTGINISSPNIQLHNHKKMYLDTFHKFKSWGVAQSPEYGAIRIHVKARDYKVSDYKNLLEAFTKSRSRLWSYFTPNATLRNLSKTLIIRKSHFISNLDDNLLLSKAVNRKNSYKIHNSGLHYSSRYRTIEFKLFNSSLDEKYFSDALLFSNAFIDAIKTNDVNVYSWINSNEPVESLLEVLSNYSKTKLNN